MYGMRKEQTDTFCQYPANEGASAHMTCMRTRVTRLRVF